MHWGYMLCSIRGSFMNSYEGVMRLWSDVDYFLNENAGDIPQGLSKRQVLEQIVEGAHTLDCFLLHGTGQRICRYFFGPCIIRSIGLRFFPSGRGECAVFAYMQ